MAARCLLLVWVKSAKGIPQPRANVFQERGRCWGILPSGGAVLGIVPGHGECEIIWATREKPDFMRVYAA